MCIRDSPSTGGGGKGRTAETPWWGPRTDKHDQTGPRAKRPGLRQRGRTRPAGRPSRAWPSRRPPERAGWGHQAKQQRGPSCAPTPPGRQPPRPR
eukprot:10333884-Alexandrium_andersonii.AAC.1